VALGVHLAHASNGPLVPAWLALSLTALTGLLLLEPRVLGLLSTLANRDRRRSHGGALRLIAGWSFELMLGSVLAPLLMLHHTRIMISILIGRAVKWGAQRRRARGKLGTIARSELPQTLVGISAATWLWYAAPGLLAWTAPVWVPLAFAIPIALLVSSERMGRWTRSAGILLVTSETEPDELEHRVTDLQALTTSDDAARFRDLVLDPLLVATQLSRLAKEGVTSSDDPALARLRQRALRMGPAAMTVDERRQLGNDPACLEFLHREAWRSWPVESWQLAREVPQLPEDRLSVASA
jgi:membrane glycosyltransferase